MISKKEKFFYGLGDLSANILFSSVSFYLLYFLVKIAGLSAFLVPIIFLIGKFWDAITDYLMGRISDNTKSKFGKRRIYMLAGAIPYGIAFMLLWILPFDMGSTVKCIYFTLIYMLYNTTFTVVYIPYNSLSANMTKDYDERTSLNAVRIVLANVGILLGAAVFSLLAEGKDSILYSVDGTEKTAYMIAGMIFGVVSVVIMIISTLNVKERVDEENNNSYSFFDTLKQFFKIKEFRCNLMFYLLSMVGFDIIMAIFMFYVRDSLGLGGGIISMMFIAIPLITAMIASVLWVNLTKKHEKHNVYGAASIYMTIALLLVFIVPKATENNSILTYVLLGVVVVLVGIGMSAIQIIPWAALPDVIEIDEYKNGVRREGAYYGIVQFAYKVASGIGVSIVSLILGAFGYVENPELTEGVDFVQPNAALTAIRVVLGVLPGLIFIVSAIFAKKGQITRKHFNDIKIELDNRKLSK